MLHISNISPGDIQSSASSSEIVQLSHFLQYLENCPQMIMQLVGLFFPHWETRFRNNDPAYVVKTTIL